MADSDGKPVDRSQPDGTPLDRRTVLVGLGGVAGALAVGGLGEDPAPGEALPVTHEGPEELAAEDTRRPPSAAVLALFGPLAPGARLAARELVRIHDVRLGAVAVVLRDETGRELQLDVLRRDLLPGAPEGPAVTPSLSLFLANRGSGSSATVEADGLAAMALAAVLSEREASGAPVPELLTFRERSASFPAGFFGVPLEAAGVT